MTHTLTMSDSGNQQHNEANRINIGGDVDGMKLLTKST